MSLKVTVNRVFKCFQASLCVGTDGNMRVDQAIGFRDSISQGSFVSNFSRNCSITVW
ncbi:MAG: hypothetical protein M2R45_03934 [Verrucomicrobia subdivision 3 bacterium]|nr:hypothetical protein [Limisphaerales bacterium]MCS1417699.1 hypothetical protein [Limisphaerales bacterium]